MNGKQAKLLRSLVGFVPSSPREYDHKTMRTVMVDTGRLDAEGNAIMVPQARVTTIAKGARKAYQQIKKM